MNSSSKSILLTGGTGVVGKKLTEQLLADGYRVSHLSRKPGNNPRVKTFLWDVGKGEIDAACVDGVDLVVHLAGAPIAESRWTDDRKKEIIDSRTKSIGIIYDLLRSKNHRVKAIVSASAIGYYSNRGDELMTEDSPPNTDFMGRCCTEWEEAVDQGAKLGLRILKFRTGVVLNEDGALKLMAQPIKLYVGSPLGSGKQWVPWIHWQDVVDMYMLGIENESFTGVYNMVAPNPVTNAELTKAIAKQLHKPLWAPKVPSFVLKLIMGEMSTIVLGSTKVSAQKIEDAGYKFKYPDIEGCLKQIYG